MPFKVFPYSCSAAIPLFFNHLRHDFFLVCKNKVMLRCLLRCFHTVVLRPYRYFSITLNMIFSLSVRHKIFTTDGP